MKRLVWSGWKAEKAAIVQDRRTPAASPRFKPLLSDAVQAARFLMLDVLIDDALTKFSRESSPHGNLL
jgi:hypothetical protein